MSILFSNEILDSVKRELNYAESSVQIITAYCKESTFNFIDNCINPDVLKKRLLVRLRMEDVLKGSSDLNVIKSGLEKGWKIYIRFDLHAKTYLFDNKRIVVGSANATNSGLGIGQHGNMEMATLVEIEPDDVSKINRLFNEAIYVDESLYRKLLNQLEAVKQIRTTENYSWDDSITSLFSPHIDTLFSYDFPDKSDFHKGDYIEFLDKNFDGNIKELKENFRWSNSYLWLVDILKENDGYMYFGELSARLHNSLVSDPKPYRRDVKKMLANLLALIETLDMEEVKIDRPNYSQRIRLSKIGG